MSTYIYQCQACPETICQTTDDTPFCQERKPFANWEKIEPVSDQKPETERLLMVELETAQQIVREEIERHLKIQPIMDDRIGGRIQHKLRTRSMLATPDGILMSRKD